MEPFNSRRAATRARHGMGSDSFNLMHWQGQLHGPNASGRCPQAMTRETFVNAGWKRMPQVGWGAVSV